MSSLTKPGGGGLPPGVTFPVDPQNVLEFEAPAAIPDGFGLSSLGGLWVITPIPGAASGIEQAFAVDFDYNTPSPLNIGAVANGDKVIISEIKTTVAFDDVASFVRLGTPALPDLLMAATDSKVSRLGTYSSNQNEDISVATNLQLIISPGASTLGSGQVIVSIRRV